MSSSRPMLHFRVAGTPAPQGSKSVSKTGHLYETSRRVKPWRDAVAATALTVLRGAGPLSGPVAVEISFRFRRPRAHYATGRNLGELRPSAPQHHVQRPDVDKLARSTLDALTSAGVFADDCQVVSLVATKEWDSLSPGATIAITPIVQ